MCVVQGLLWSDQLSTHVYLRHLAVIHLIRLFTLSGARCRVPSTGSWMFSCMEQQGLSTWIKLKTLVRNAPELIAELLNCWTALEDAQDLPKTAAALPRLWHFVCVYRKLSCSVSFKRRLDFTLFLHGFNLHTSPPPTTIPCWTKLYNNIILFLRRDVWLHVYYLTKKLYQLIQWFKTGFINDFFFKLLADMTNFFFLLFFSLHHFRWAHSLAERSDLEEQC